MSKTKIKLTREQIETIEKALDINIYKSNDIALRIINGENISDVSREELSRQYKIIHYRIYVKCNLLHVAAASNNTKALIHLLNNGFDIESQTDDPHKTAIILAVETNSIEALKVLIERGANIDYKTPYGGSTALTIACEKNHIICVKMLIKAGANLNLTDEVYPPIGITYNLELLEALVKAGANINQKIKTFGTIFHKFCYQIKYQEDLLLPGLKCLLENGVDVTIKDNTEMTAFDIVLEQRNYISAAMIYEKLPEADKAKVQNDNILMLVEFQKVHPELKLETIASFCFKNKTWTDNKWFDSIFSYIENNKSNIVFMQNLLNPYDILELEDLTNFQSKYLVAKNLYVDLDIDLREPFKILKEPISISHDIMSKILEKKLAPKFKSGFFSAILGLPALKNAIEVSSAELSNLKPDALDCEDRKTEREVI